MCLQTGGLECGVCFIIILSAIAIADLTNSLLHCLETKLNNALLWLKKGYSEIKAAKAHEKTIWFSLV